MATAIRMYQSEGIYFVTARTQQGRLLLRPSPRVNGIIGGILARAARRYGIGVRGFVFMSNHVHLLVRAKQTNLSRFMQYLLSNIARKVGAAQGWSGALWQRRFSCEPVLDSGAEEGRLRYILSHGVKERLVGHHRDWPGLSCFTLLTEGAQRYPYFNWNWRWSRADCAQAKRWSEQLVEHESLELEPITAWAGFDEATRAQLADRLTDAQATEHAHGGPPRGRKAVLQASPRQAIALERRPFRPLCHTTSRLVLYQWLRMYTDHRTAYEEASRRFRSGDMTVEFPLWSFLPSSLAERPPPPETLPSPEGPPRVELHVFTDPRR